MNWLGYFIAAMILMTGAILWALWLLRNKHSRGRFLSPIKLLFGGVFAATLLLFCPIYRSSVENTAYSGLETLLLSLHSTFQIFTLDSDRSIILEMIQCEPAWLKSAYTVFISIAYIAGPILTFGFVITFFRNVTAYFRCLLSFCRDGYVFSDLNERSILLAKSIRAKDPKAAIIFTDVFEGEAEEQYELVQQAKEIRAICFKKDILTINFRYRLRKRELSFFIMGENEPENVQQTLSLLNAFNDREHTSLYVFSTGVEGELLLSAANRGKVRVRRINEARSVINRTLYEQGHTLFDSARTVEGEKEKKISVLLLGLGRYGTEMLKALTWYCQMDGYTFEVNVFDSDPKAEEIFSASCPELMSEDYNGTSIPGEAAYTIRFYSGIDVRTKTFADQVSQLKDTTYAFISLGSDARNLEAAVEMRMLFERMRIKPAIHAVLHNSEEKTALADICNYRGQPYDITFIGDLAASYSESVILNSELEQEALERHLKWGKEDEFWRFEYNYNSSIAAALHLHARIHCRIPGAEKSEDELQGEERTAYEALEHRRWNAYMRAQGYIFSGSTEKSSRNDLGKMHNDLVDYSSLSEEEKRKDSRVGTRKKS